MPTRLDDVIPSQLTEHTEMIGKGDYVILFATSNAIFWINIVKAKGRGFPTVLFACVDGGTRSKMFPLFGSGL